MNKLGHDYDVIRECQIIWPRWAKKTTEFSPYLTEPNLTTIHHNSTTCTLSPACIKTEMGLNWIWFLYFVLKKKNVHFCNWQQIQIKHILIAHSSFKILSVIWICAERRKPVPWWLTFGCYPTRRQINIYLKQSLTVMVLSWVVKLILIDRVAVGIVGLEMY